MRQRGKEGGRGERERERERDEVEGKRGGGERQMMWRGREGGRER